MTETLLTAVFIGPVSTVIITVADPWCWDTGASVVTFELVFTTCYTHTTKTLSQNTYVHMWCSTKLIIVLRFLPLYDTNIELLSIEH